MYNGELLKKIRLFKGFNQTGLAKKNACKAAVHFKT